MKTYTIHLIRHGLCQGNLEGRYIGRTQSPLSDKGFKELLDLKTKYKYPYAKSFYASPSTRCVDSLKILYPDSAEPSVILEMAECDFGAWENKTAEDLKNDETFLQFLDGKNGVSPPDGESMSVFIQRVCSGFETLVKNMLFSGTDSAVLVTHAGVIMTILAAYGLPRAKMTDWMCESGHGYSIRFETGLWSSSNVVEVYQTLPISEDEKDKPEHTFIDIAREAADKALG